MMSYLGFLIQLVFCKNKNYVVIGVEVEQETSAPPPKKIPGSAPAYGGNVWLSLARRPRKKNARA